MFSMQNFAYHFNILIGLEEDIALFRIVHQNIAASQYSVMVSVEIRD